MSVRERSGSTLDPKRYRQLVQERAPKPNVVRDATRAFLLGGCIALIGQFVFDYFSPYRTHSRRSGCGNARDHDLFWRRAHCLRCV